MRKILLLCLLYLVEGYLNDGLESISITRHHKGDVFAAQGGKCYKDLCLGLSSGTGARTGSSECECKCLQNRPVYRDDLNICVDDLQECTLVPFASNNAVKKIPYVFLPLKGQIVYPSAEIIISDEGNPVCVVSGGQFLGRTGWMNLRNNSGLEPPFRLFRDEGRTYLQWLGETSLRMAMEGRIILVHLMCKDANSAEEPRIFTPCIAFRVAGNPSIREVMFATDVHLKEEFSGGLTIREYVAIGICSLLLGAVYVASVFLYLHWRRRKQRENKKCGEGAQLTLGEEGVIKSNPLLQASRHLGMGGQDNAGYISDSNSCCSDEDQSSDLLCLDEEDLAVHQNMQTSAIIHPCEVEYGETTLNQDSSNIEKLPEENVSIVETLETKEDYLETVKGMGCTNGRRKLYFNPSYFEPDLLKAPPPAALEFLIKIREVIAIAKHKMSVKKFSPSLLGIPEEDGSQKTDGTSVLTARQESTKGVEKRESCEVYPPTSKGTVKDNFNLDFCCPMDVKQRIIRKWLEDIPILIQTEEHKSKESGRQKIGGEEGKIINRSKLWQMNEEKSGNGGKNLGKDVKIPVPPVRQDKKRPSTKGKAPPLPPQQIPQKSPEPAPKSLDNSGGGGSFTKTEFSSFQPSVPKISNGVQTKAKTETGKIPPPCPPPLPSFSKLTDEVPRVQGKDRVPPAVAKNLMDAVIQELTGLKKIDKLTKSKDSVEPQKIEAETFEEKKEGAKKETPQEDKGEKEGLEVKSNDKGILNGDGKSDSLVGSEDVNATHKIDPQLKSQDDHEYEVILLNANPKPLPEEKDKDVKIYNLPEILSKNDKNEGYSLVSEVYVNDGYSCCSSGESPPSSYSNMSVESDKIHYEIMNEKPGRLTIHVNDSPEQYKQNNGESDNFEPDTLDRKPRKSKQMKKVKEKGEEGERYSNQKFHAMECYVSSTNNSGSNENFTDSLERPSIMLKTNGSFKRNSLEKNIDDLLRNFNWSKVENYGTLREIYEAKSRNHRRRTGTTSLIDSVNSDTDRISTLSWGEERKNKLLHRGIVLHINEEGTRKHKTRTAQCRSHVAKGSFPDKAPMRPPKPCPSPASRSQSPNPKSIRAPPSSKSTASPVFRHPSSSPRSISPPLPPPRSVPLIPPQIQPRSTTSSPIAIETGTMNRKNLCATPPLHSPGNSLVFRSSSKNSFTTPSCSTCTSPIPSSTQPSLSSISSAPPRPPKEPVDKSPSLPPRNAKPPLPPKNGKGSRQRVAPSKFASRPLPPLPSPRPTKDFSSSSPVPYKDPETLSTLSGASMDSLNSSEYEAFYTLPYEEEAGSTSNDDFRSPKPDRMCSNGITVISTTGSPSFNVFDVDRRAGQFHFSPKSRNLVSKNSWEGINRAIPHRPEDSGYLSTDSNESCKIILSSSNFSGIPEGGSQNSETEESFCDGASESGAESIATDSFFYGNFKKSPVDKLSEPSSTAEVYPYSLRLSDVEVNSDTERHCVPIMVRP